MFTGGGTGSLRGCQTSGLDEYVVMGESSTLRGSIGWDTRILAMPSD
jgi:hypothetical protein